MNKPNNCIAILNDDNEELILLNGINRIKATNRSIDDAPILILFFNDDRRTTFTFECLDDRDMLLMNIKKSLYLFQFDIYMADEMVITEVTTENVNKM